MRLLGVPDSAPPYDDGLAEAGPRGETRPGRPARAPRRPKATARREPRPRLSPAPQPEPAKLDVRDEPPSPSAPRLPRRGPAGAAVWPSQFAQVLAETLAGSRPPGQIRPWASEQARRRIRQLGPTLATDVQPRVRRVMTSRPADGVVEMTVIVRFGPRIRVLAVRLERGQPYPAGTRSQGPYRAPGPDPDASAARWLCTAIEAA